MNKKNNRFIKLFSILALGILLVACGTNNDSPASESSTNEDSANIRFSWWGNSDRHEVTLEAIDKYTQENSNVSIEAEYSGFGDIEERITTQVAGGTEPDILTILYSQVGQYSPNGDRFVDLEEYSNILDLSQYDEEFLQFGYSNGVLQALPYGENTLVVAVNKTVFDDLGVEIPDNWEGYKEIAELMPEGSYPLVSPTTRFAATVYLQQKTGLTEFDEEGNMNYTEEDYLDAMKWYLDLVDAGVFASRQSYLENVGSEPESIAQNPKFISGEYAGVLEWSGGLESYAATLEEEGDELVLAPFPTIENAVTQGSMSKPSLLFAISPNSKNIEQTVDFMQFLVNEPEGIKTLGLSRGVPASDKAIEVLTEDGQLDGIHGDVIEHTNNLESLNQTPFYEDASLTSLYQTQLERVELGQASVEEAAHEVYVQTEQIASSLAK